MREIKFRGKNTFNNRWEYGSLVKEKDGALWIIPEDQMLISKGGSFSAAHVSSETVGQFTGLKDKNGVEIYEGDVVRKKSNTYPNVGMVKYCDNSCQFVVESEYAAFDLTECYATGEHLSEYVYNEYEVIGNIHDNPNLLT